MRRAAEVARPNRSRTVNRPVLVSNLLAGGALAGGSMLLGIGWPLSLLATGYVAVSSIFLAVVYARHSLSTMQEVLAWSAPWLLAVGLWTVVVAGVEGGTSGSLLNVWAGFLLGTGCYLVWQTIALAVRLLISGGSRSGKVAS